MSQIPLRSTFPAQKYYNLSYAVNSSWELFKLSFDFFFFFFDSEKMLFSLLFLWLQVLLLGSLFFLVPSLVAFLILILHLSLLINSYFPKLIKSQKLPGLWELLAEKFTSKGKVQWLLVISHGDFTWDSFLSPYQSTWLKEKIFVEQLCIAFLLN